MEKTKIGSLGLLESATQFHPTDSANMLPGLRRSGAIPGKDSTLDAPCPPYSVTAV